MPMGASYSHLTQRNVKNFVHSKSQDPHFNVLQQPPKHFGLLTIVVVLLLTWVHPYKPHLLWPLSLVVGVLSRHPFSHKCHFLTLDSIFLPFHSGPMIFFCLKKIFSIVNMWRNLRTSKTQFTLQESRPMWNSNQIKHSYWCKIWNRSRWIYTRSQGQCETQIKHSYWCKSWNRSRWIYTRSQGQCETQIKHSYWCKSWNWPRRIYTRSQGQCETQIKSSIPIGAKVEIGHDRFTLGVKAEIGKNIFSICPQLLIHVELLWPCIGLKGWEKGYHQV